MKKLTILTTLIVSMMVSSTSYAKWKDVGTYANAAFYIDFDRIRKVDGFSYYWSLANFLKPIKGNLSSKSYWQGDCKLFRLKGLRVSVHKQPMGQGTGVSYTFDNPKWVYPPPNSGMESNLKLVCAYRKSG